MSGHADTPGVRRAWGWVGPPARRAVRRPGRDWAGEGAARGRLPPRARSSSSCCAGSTRPAPSPPSSADRVLEASAPGRGRPDLELVGAGRPRSLRPAAGRPGRPPRRRAAPGRRRACSPRTSLAAGLPDAGAGRGRGPGGTRYRLVGDPMLAGPRRADLLARRPAAAAAATELVAGARHRRRPDAGRRLDRAQPRRRARCRGRTGSARAAARRRAARPDRPGRGWPGAGPSGSAATGCGWCSTSTRCPRLVGARRPPRPAPELSADAVDLARRVGSGAGAARRARPSGGRCCASTLVPAAGSSARAARWCSRAEHLDWARARARTGCAPACSALATLSTAIRTACCRSIAPASREPSDAGVLALALRLLLEKRWIVSTRVLLHVGTPKTGHVVPPGRALPQPSAPSPGPGILYPADRFDAHFLAALDLMRMPWGGLEGEAVGPWDRLAAAGPRAPRHRDHQPRDPGDRVAGPGRAGR